jgi:hypothetical protein
MGPYFTENRFDYVLSFYRSPFFYHNPGFDQAQFIHFPWAVPDSMIYTGPIRAEVMKLPFLAASSAMLTIS